MPARRSRSGASVALWEAPPRAAQRWPLHYRGGGHAAFQSGKAAGYCRGAPFEFRADAGQISTGPKRAARTRTQAAAETRLPSPETCLIIALGWPSRPDIRVRPTGPRGGVPTQRSAAATCVRVWKVRFTSALLLRRTIAWRASY